MDIIIFSNLLKVNLILVIFLPQACKRVNVEKRVFNSFPGRVSKNKPTKSIFFVV